jgi:hypothetical protein
MFSPYRRFTRIWILMTPPPRTALCGTRRGGEPYQDALPASTHSTVSGPDMELRPRSASTARHTGRDAQATTTRGHQRWESVPDHTEGT